MTDRFLSPGSSGKGGNQQRNNETRHDVEADEVDNGVINSGSQEISRDDLDDADGTASARVRFEIDKAESKRNGVRCENGQSVNGAWQVLTASRSVNDSPRFENNRPIIVQQNRTNGVIAGEQKKSRETDNVEIREDEWNANGDRDSQIVGEKPVIVDIVRDLVESR